MECAYCGTSWKQKNNACANCGAPNKVAQVDKMLPIFYDGYIVYMIDNYCGDFIEFHFYKGVTYFGCAKVPRMVLERNVKPGEEFMPFVMSVYNNDVRATSSLAV